MLMSNSSPSTGDVNNNSIIDENRNEKWKCKGNKRNGWFNSMEKNVVNLIAEYRSGSTVYLHAPVGYHLLQYVT